MEPIASDAQTIGNTLITLLSEAAELSEAADPPHVDKTFKTVVSESMTWIQRVIRLDPRPRGFHIVTKDLLRELPEVADFEIGFAHFFIQHTSASLTLNENASPSVRDDFERHVNELVPEDAPYWTHTIEGSDDMPAHVKASIFGAGLTIPIRKGRLALGTWQGVYLCEHRNRGGERKIVATLFGE